MVSDESKKVLIVAGVEHEPKRLLGCIPHIRHENIFILQHHDPCISHPLDDVMRDILITVYREGVTEIIIAAAKKNPKDDSRELDKILKNKDLQDKLQTLDYLFEHCRPDFPEGSIQKWLEGSGTAGDKLRQSADLIRNHPLMPANIRVIELLLDKEAGKTGARLI